MTNDLTYVLLLFMSICAVQFCAAREWERLVWCGVPRTSRSYLKIGIFWGGLGISLPIFDAMTVNAPGMIRWMSDKSLEFGFVVLAITTATWVAWSTIEHHRNTAVKVFNLFLVACLLTFHYPVLVFLKTNTLALHPAHLLVFAAHVISFAAVIALATVTLGFPNLSEFRHRGRLAAFASHPRTIFTMACVMLDSLWMVFQQELIKLNQPELEESVLGLVGDSTSTQGVQIHIMMTLLATGVFVALIDGYARRQTVRVQDKLAWHAESEHLPGNEPLRLQQTSLIRKALNLNDVAMVTWNAPDAARGIGTSDFRSGTTFVSPGPIHDAGLQTLGADINLPDFWKAILHPEDHADALKQISRLLSQEGEDSFHSQWRFKSGSGQWLTIRGRFEVRRSPVNGLPICAYGIHTNVSEEIAANELLGAAKMRQLNALRMISHDLRGSIGTVLMASSVIQHLVAKNPDLAVDKNLSRIKSAADEALDFLDSAVAYARTEDPQSVGEPVNVDLHQLLTGIVQRETTRFKVAEDKVEIDCPSGVLLADVLLFPLTSVLTNLISNGIKYTPDPTGKVRVRVSAQSSASSEIIGQTVIEIADEGVGIPPEFIDRIFKSFSRADNVGKIEGYGLGMAIVANALQLLNAKIHVVSVPQVQRGSVVTVMLPNRLTTG